MLRIPAIIIGVFSISMVMILITLSVIEAAQNGIEKTILTNSTMLDKFDQGYTEVCYEEITHDGISQTCLFPTDKWSPGFMTEKYYAMHTDDFCVYRFFVIPHAIEGYIEDGKEKGTCHTELSIKWEREHWDIKYIDIKNREFLYLVYND